MRYAAPLGVIRILIERSQPLPLNELIRYAFEQHTAQLKYDTVETVLHYILGAWAIGTTMREYISLLSEQCSQRRAPICLTLTSLRR